MRKLKIYLETTILNFYFADDALEKKTDTLKLFDEIKEGKYSPCSSFAVIAEMEKTRDECKRNDMISLIEKFGVHVVQDNQEFDVLADTYVREGVIPEKYRDDALHIAVATMAEADVIVSWNFQHIVRMKTRNMVNVINLREGYRTIEICSPSEVIENDE